MVKDTAKAAKLEKKLNITLAGYLVIIIVYYYYLISFISFYFINNPFIINKDAFSSFIKKNYGNIWRNWTGENWIEFLSIVKYIWEKCNSQANWGIFMVYI